MHVDPDLSAYLDGELAPAERARVAAHLAACEQCSARASELRSAASLVHALPVLRPRRSLVPPITPRFAWLRVVRSLSAIASGAFLFVFLVTAVARSGSGLGGGDSTAPASQASALAAPFAANAPAASALPAALPPSVAPAPAGAAADAAQRSGSTAAPTSAAVKAAENASAGPSALALQTETARQLSAHSTEPGPLLDPRLWVVLAILAAVVAGYAHVRLRRT